MSLTQTDEAFIKDLHITLGLLALAPDDVQKLYYINNGISILQALRGFYMAKLQQCDD